MQSCPALAYSASGTEQFLFLESFNYMLEKIEFRVQFILQVDNKDWAELQSGVL